MRKAPGYDWHLADWMERTELSQADLCRATGYPKAKMSELVNGVSRYNRDVVNALAFALDIRPFELLMSPEQAEAFREFQASANKLATLVYDADAEPADIHSKEAFEKRDLERARQRKVGTKGSRGTGTGG
jgi:transcriptional regulator with XRE-family HTH domain